jgi:hypothetical protein
MSNNDITGDNLRSRVVTDEYRENYDAIFGQDPLAELYAQADEQLETYGMVDTDLLANIGANGGIITKYV